MQDCQIVQRPCHIRSERIGVFLHQSPPDRQALGVKTANTMILFVLQQEIRIVAEQSGQLLRGDQAARRSDGLVVDGDDLRQPFLGHRILQSLDFQPILLDIGFESAERLRFQFAGGTDTGGVRRRIAVDLHEVQHGVGPLVIALFEETDRFGQTRRRDGRREPRDELGCLQQIALHRFATFGQVVQLLPEIAFVRVFQHPSLRTLDVAQQLQILGVVAGEGHLLQFDQRLPVDLDFRVADLQQRLRPLVLVGLELQQETQPHRVDVLEPAIEMSVFGGETILERLQLGSDLRRILEIDVEFLRVAAGA